MAALTPLAQASVGGTLYVNANTGMDSGTCRLAAHPCATISYALTKSSTTATSTIDVAAGNYPKALAITHSVSIVGAADSGASATIIDPSTLITDTDTDSSIPQDTVVDVTGTSGVTLKDLEVSGTNAESDFTGCGDDFVGVYYHDSSGTMNTVQVTGIELTGDLFGCQDGQAVYVASDAGDTSSVTMTKLKINNFQKNGVTCDDAGTTCSLGGSAITGIGPNDQIAPNGFQGVDTASVTLNKNSIKDNSYTVGGPDSQATGVLIFDVGAVTVTGNTLGANDINAYFGSDGTGPGEQAWTISGNTVSNAADNVPGGSAGFGWGIQLDSTSNSVSISDNTVHGSKAYGIALTGANNATVNGNTVTGSGSDGIYVGGPGSVSGATFSGGNFIEDNNSNANHGDGIHADTDSDENTFSGNTTKTNLLYDLEDAGTGNSWTSDACTPAHDSNPAGLCD
ncbi:MAG: right-handed parallel beta-helix repeat-containing protein [Streptosporangiaceae bacterium]